MKPAKHPRRIWAVIFARTGTVYSIYTQKYRAEHIARTRDQEMRVVEYVSKESP